MADETMIVLLLPMILDMVIGLSQTLSPDAACHFLRCGDKTRCRVRYIDCTYDGCPTMVYCVSEDIEDLTGPFNCDKVICSSGYSCLVTLQQQSAGAQTVATCLSDSSLVRDACSEIDCPEGSYCEERSVDECPHPPCLSSVPVCIPNVIMVEGRFQSDTPSAPDVCRGFHCPGGYVCQESVIEFCIHPPCASKPVCVPLDDWQNMTRGEDDPPTVTDVCHGFRCPEGMDCHERQPVFCPQPPCYPEPVCVPFSELSPLIQNRQFSQFHASRPRNVCDRVKCAKGGYCYKGRSHICDNTGMCREYAWCALPPGFACLSCPPSTYCVYGTLTCKKPPCNKYAYCVPWKIDVRDICDRVKCRDGYVCKKRLLDCPKKPCRQYAFCAPNEDGSNTVSQKSICDRVTCPKGSECVINTVKCPKPPCQRYARCVGVKEPDEADCQCPPNSVCRRGFINCKNPPCPTYLYCDIATVDDAYCNCTEKGMCRRGWLDCKSPPCPYYFHCGTEDVREVADGCRGLNCGDGFQCREEADEDCHQPPCEPRPVCVPMQRRAFMDELHNSPLTGISPVQGVCADFQCPKGSDCHEKKFMFCPAPPCQPVPVCIPTADRPPVDSLHFARRTELLPIADVCRGVSCGEHYHCETKPVDFCAQPVCHPVPVCIMDKVHSLTQPDSSQVPDTCHGIQCPEGSDCHERVEENCLHPPCQPVAVCVPLKERSFKDDLHPSPAKVPEACRTIQCPRGTHCHQTADFHCPRPPCRLEPVCFPDQEAPPQDELFTSPLSDNSTSQIPEVCRDVHCPENLHCHELTYVHCRDPPCSPEPVCVLDHNLTPKAKNVSSPGTDTWQVPDVCRGFPCPEGSDCHETTTYQCPQPPCPSVPVCVRFEKKPPPDTVQFSVQTEPTPVPEVCRFYRCPEGYDCHEKIVVNCPQPPCSAQPVCVPFHKKEKLKELPSPTGSGQDPEDCQGVKCPNGSVCVMGTLAHCPQPPCPPVSVCVRDKNCAAESLAPETSQSQTTCQGFPCPDGSICEEKITDDCPIPPCLPVPTCVTSPSTASTSNPSTEKEPVIIPEVCRGYQCPEGSLCFERTPHVCAEPPCTPRATCIPVLRDWTRNCSLPSPTEGA